MASDRPGLGILAGLCLMAVASPAAAAGFDSAYTDIDLDQCTVISSDDMGSVWACPGYKGIPVRIAEGDLRFFVSYGFSAGDEPSAGQTPPPFNYLGPKIEWRLTNASGGWKPFATIVRYFVSKDESGTEGQVLVVTRIEEGATCQIAYIDALANPEPNVLARKAADENAGEFDCSNEPEIIGKFEAWDR
jgi:hypothetical protein